MKYITAPAAARRAGKTSETIKNWCRAGKLEFYITPGGHWMVNTSSLAELLDTSGRVAPLQRKPLPPLTRRYGGHTIKLAG